MGSYTCEKNINLNINIVERVVINVHVLKRTLIFFDKYTKVDGKSYLYFRTLGQKYVYVLTEIDDKNTKLEITATCLATPKKNAEYLLSWFTDEIIKDISDMHKQDKIYPEIQCNNLEEFQKEVRTLVFIKMKDAFSLCNDKSYIEDLDSKIDAVVSQLTNIDDFSSNKVYEWASNIIKYLSTQYFLELSNNDLKKVFRYISLAILTSENFVLLKKENNQDIKEILYNVNYGHVEFMQRCITNQYRNELLEKYEDILTNTFCIMCAFTIILLPIPIMRLARKIHIKKQLKNLEEIEDMRGIIKVLKYSGLLTNKEWMVV